MTSMPKAPLQHVAIIMDGNRRWAKAHGLNIIGGHERVANQIIEPLVDRCIELGIQYLTLWTFSTENWKRDAIEIDGIMGLFRKAFEKQAEDLHRKGVRLNILGDLSRFPKDIMKRSQEWVELSQHNTKITVNFALNYGGHDEIVRAMHRACADGVDMCEMTATDIESHLDTAGMPAPDLIIRPGGEMRLSGFMSWQSAYSECYFTQTLMPDFSSDELDKALEEFEHRKRRFGK